MTPNAQSIGLTPIYHKVGQQGGNPFKTTAPNVNRKLVLTTVSKCVSQIRTSFMQARKQTSRNQPM